MEKHTLTTTHGEYQEFARFASVYLNQSDLKPSHLTLALTKTIKENKHHIEDFNDLIAEAKIDLAQKDKDGTIILHQNGTYKMKPDAAKKMQKQGRKIKDKEIKVVAYIAKEVPRNLALPWYEYFVPFVIKNYPDPVVEEIQPDKEE